MPAKSKSKKAPQAPLPQVRIIGGQWRSRKLSFPEIEGLRPTPDRVRETLFNWLQSAVPGARCLDLFAGSGALGIEALSRGASRCMFIDIAPLSTKALRDNIQKLDCTDAEVAQRDVIQWLKQLPDEPAEDSPKFDIVFLDPPFSKGFAQSVCTLLTEKKLLNRNAYIYVETEPRAVLQHDWALHREKISGKVHYRLFKTN